MACAKAAGSDVGLLIGGRRVVADLAVGKEEAKDMAVGLAVSVRDKDKRNLYLAEVSRNTPDRYGRTSCLRGECLSSGALVPNNAWWSTVTL